MKSQLKKVTGPVIRERMRVVANGYGIRGFNRYLRKASWLSEEQKLVARSWYRHHRTVQLEFEF